MNLLKLIFNSKSLGSKQPCVKYRSFQTMCKSQNGELGNGMRGMMGTQGIKVGMRRTRVGIRGIVAGMLGMQGLQGISVRMQGIRVKMQGISVGV